MRRKILVIDDDLDMLSILGFVLEEEGFEVELRSTGAYATDICGIEPALILLDVRINGYPRSGIEICREFKSSGSLDAVPVILLSSEHNLPELAISCGCDGYIRKPFDITSLVNQVKGFLTN